MVDPIGAGDELTAGPSPWLDEALDALTRRELVKEIIRLRQGIRAHRDSTRHDLCWHHPDLWDLLPEVTDPLPSVPDWPEFLAGCIRYRSALDVEVPQSTDGVGNAITPRQIG